MMQATRYLLLALGLPMLVLADLNTTVTLQGGESINLETGATPGSPVDLLWNGATLAPQGNATALLLYDDFPEEQINFITSLQIQLTPGYTRNALGAAVGDLIGVHTNGNHWSRILVKAKSAGSITLRFTTFGVAQTPGGGSGGVPTITSILNNSSFIREGMPNYGIAPSSLFVVLGTGLADAGLPVLQDSGAGLPRLLNGAKITVKVNTFSEDTPIYYTSPTQIAAVLPALTPIGDGTVTITYKGVASNSYPLHVVPAALGINTYNGNTGVATDAITYALLTYANSGFPGQILTLWTTGLGSDPADSDSTLTFSPHAVNTPLEIYIGGIRADILYQGASTYPGVNQINFTIPAGVPNGCWVSLVGVAGGVLSNTATLPINAGGGQCADTVTNLTASQISAGGTQSIRTGFVALIQTDKPKDNGREILTSTTASFRRYTGVYTPSNTVSPGGCIVNDLTPVSIADTTGLGPGTLRLTGPGNVSVAVGQQLGIKGAYFAQLAAGAIPASGGTFTFTGADGGADVGAFTSNISFTGPVMTWTNQSAAADVDRAQGVTVTWDGGNPGTNVAITGTSATPSGTGAGFSCWAPIDAHTFTVPAYILSALPAGKGAIELQNYVYSPLTATGLDIAYAIGDISIAANAAFR